MATGRSTKKQGAIDSHDVQSIEVEGRNLSVEYRRMPIEDLRLDAANPRTRHVVQEKQNGHRLSQQDLQELVMAMPGVSGLFRSIRDNGGLMEPVYVESNGLVIEGNCRLACLLRLHDLQESDPRWQSVPTYVIPGISKRQIAVLQSQLHVAGKNKWRAYEKAGHLYHMRHKLGMSLEEIARAAESQVRVVKRLLASYEVMTEKVLPHRPHDGMKKWSYVLELFKHKDLEAYRSDPANIDHFVDMIFTGVITRGADVRRLPEILKHEPAAKALKKNGMQEAIKVVGRHDPTTNSSAFKKIRELTTLMSNLPGADIKRLKNEKKAQHLIRELADAVNNVATLTGISL